MPRAATQSAKTRRGWKARRGTEGKASTSMSGSKPEVRRVIQTRVPSGDWSRFRKTRTNGRGKVSLFKAIGLTFQMTLEGGSCVEKELCKTYEIRVQNFKFLHLQGIIRWTESPGKVETTGNYRTESLQGSLRHEPESTWAGSPVYTEPGKRQPSSDCVA